MDSCSELLRLSVECIGYVTAISTYFSTFQHSSQGLKGEISSHAPISGTWPRRQDSHSRSPSTTISIASAVIVLTDCSRRKKSHRFAQVSAPPFSDPPFSSRSGCCSADPLAIACDVLCRARSSPYLLHLLWSAIRPGPPPPPHLQPTLPIAAYHGSSTGSRQSACPSAVIGPRLYTVEFACACSHLLASPPDRHISYFFGMSVLFSSSSWLVLTITITCLSSRSACPSAAIGPRLYAVDATPFACRFNRRWCTSCARSHLLPIEVFHWCIRLFSSSLWLVLMITIARLPSRVRVSSSLYTRVSLLSSIAFARHLSLVPLPHSFQHVSEIDLEHLNQLLFRTLRASCCHPAPACINTCCVVAILCWCWCAHRSHRPH